MEVQLRKPKLLDQVRQRIRAKHYYPDNREQKS
jgi:hypothetical protein